ncbi:MAG: hypothetical protein N4A50_05685 [Vallitalea sp.]|jgi:hypothetical protein|nr:hypothetical protein [Vallitalea sp.]
MLNSRKLLKIKIKSKKTRIVIPIPLIVFWGLLECIEDLLAVLSFILPNKNIKINKKSYKLKESFNLFRYIVFMLEEVKYCEPFDLVDIVTDEDMVKISIR